jgi:diaminopimelate decarboxylase
VVDSPVALSPAARQAVSLAEIARRVGTPVYVYRGAEIAGRYTAFDAAFGGYPHRVHYALKANSTLAVARLVRSLGGGVDANSGGEIDVALRAGFAPRDIVFTGVGKTAAELAQAVALDLHAVNAESAGELERIDRLARACGVRTRVALRVNPDVAAGGHPHISTGGRAHKFGVPLAAVREVCDLALACDGLQLVGLHVHIGSQVAARAPIRDALAAVVLLAADLLERGCPLEHIDVGGGLGISYDGSETLGVDLYASTVIDAVRPTGLEIIAEPGRWIVGPAGVLVASVVDVKPQDDDRCFVVLDSGMSELLRPALYGAYHRVEPLEPRPGRPVVCDVVGPICETGDVVGAARSMPRPAVGDLVAIFDTGAYGSAMASNYNRHPLPAEVLIDEREEWRIIRRRQTRDDMVALET